MLCRYDLSTTYLHSTTTPQQPLCTTPYLCAVIHAAEQTSALRLLVAELPSPKYFNIPDFWRIYCYLRTHFSGKYCSINCSISDVFVVSIEWTQEQNPSHFTPYCPSLYPTPSSPDSDSLSSSVFLSLFTTHTPSNRIFNPDKSY